LATSATTIWVRRRGLGLDGDQGNGAGGEREDKRRCEHEHTVAIRHAIADAARRNGLNVDGQYGHCGERRGENDFLHDEPPEFQLPPPLQSAMAGWSLKRFTLAHRTTCGNMCTKMSAREAHQGQRHVRREALAEAVPVSIDVPCRAVCQRLPTM
jgi:hypothetical protein